MANIQLFTSGQVTLEVPARPGTPLVGSPARAVTFGVSGNGVNITPFAQLGNSVTLVGTAVEDGCERYAAALLHGSSQNEFRPNRSLSSEPRSTYPRYLESMCRRSAPSLRSAGRNRCPINWSLQRLGARRPDFPIATVDASRTIRIDLATVVQCGAGRRPRPDFLGLVVTLSGQYQSGVHHRHHRRTLCAGDDDACLGHGVPPLVHQQCRAAGWLRRRPRRAGICQDIHRYRRGAGAGTLGPRDRQVHDPGAASRAPDLPQRRRTAAGRPGVRGRRRPLRELHHQPSGRPDPDAALPPQRDGSARRPPGIATAPATTSHGSTITVRTSGSTPRFSLVRTSAGTHSLNTDQRRIPLTATTATALTTRCRYRPIAVSSCPATTCSSP